MLATKLIEIGFSGDEAKIYLALLELGGAYAGNLARKTQINRVNVYYILNELKKRGIVSEVDKNKLKFYTCVAPKVLLKKEEAVLEKIRTMIPELTAIENVHAIKPLVKYFEGIEGIIQVYEDTLNEKDEIVGYSNLELVMEVISEYMDRYATEKIKNNLKSRIIAPGTEKAKMFLDKFYFKDPERKIMEILFVSPKAFVFENDIFIYGNKLAIVSLKGDEMFGMILESGSVARTQRSLFNLAWLGATSFVAG
ncbi:hypothetical protein M0P48_05360 [Candidatus Gracilibacteria bacterium]|jgi:sugar-specific transcriptional regulator TrmB|nr:hypothetical protein [Candidatus Gracilibacteria bacterium]